MNAYNIQRALLSVFDKTHLIAFAEALHARGIELLASGGTADALMSAKLPVTPIEEFTQAPEVLGGRVKTLHPKVHAGILADRNNEKHLQELSANGYALIDLVVCNLYPFQSYLAQGYPRAALIEKIDIGGPTMVRAAAKNVDGGVLVLAQPSDYEHFIEQLDRGITHSYAKQLAAKAFRLIADYDLAIAHFAEEQAYETNYPLIEGALPCSTLRYGENPHQRAWLYRYEQEPHGLAWGTLLQGKELSYNNYLDLEAAYRAVDAVGGVACSIIKHTNPCGLSKQATQIHAFQAAYDADRISAFGGILGFNTPLQASTAQAILDSQLFLECIAAPGFEPEALALLQHKINLRLFQVSEQYQPARTHMHRISGGILVQDLDLGPTNTQAWQCVTQAQVPPDMLPALLFAYQTVALFKSNAITVCNHQTLLGFGTGQTNRIDAAAHALERAGHASKGAMLASDAFFPFSDCVELAAKAGIRYIVQPGGSKRDQESIDACNKHGIAMMFTQQRHFKH